MKFGNSCYLFSTTKIAWKDSSEFCEEHDAQLVIISSKKEQVNGQKNVSFSLLFNSLQCCQRAVNATKTQHLLPLQYIICILRLIFSDAVRK